MLRRALLIRRFEELLLELFAQGKLNGTVHTCLGQEWSGVAVAQAAQPGDTVFSNHRGHGHYLAFHENAEDLLAEIMGKSTGLCGGFGGSQHLCDRGFYSNGILGGMSPSAVGSAWAHRLKTDKNISIVFHGDGAFGEGIIYESMNIAVCWNLPVLWVIERNGYAQSTDCRQTIAGSIEARAMAFGLRYFRGDTWHHRDLIEKAAEAMGYVRAAGAPAVLEIETYRLAAHSKGDDNRDPREIESFRKKDPLNLLLEQGDASLIRLDSEIKQELAKALLRCEAALPCEFRPKPNDAGARSIVWTIIRQEATTKGEERYSALIYREFVALFSRYQDLVMIGEDIEGHYGGAFKVSRDLSQRYPGRVRNTPISEAAIVGVGTGLALGGQRPIVEIMFGDFLSLAFDQLLQHACKFETMYGGKVSVPLIVRTPMGGRRGYGPTHSQCIESHFLGIPGLTVLALNVRVDPARIYRDLVEKIRHPALVIENKILYTRPLRTKPPQGYNVFLSGEEFPCVRVSPESIAPQITVVCYGGMVEIVEDCLLKAFEEMELLCELICPTQLAPLNLAPIAESVRRTGKVLIVEEGKTFAAFGGEVLAQLIETNIVFKARRLGYDHYIPASFVLENQLLPNEQSILKTLRELLHE